jgi:hypothetical protein
VNSEKYQLGRIYPTLTTSLYREVCFRGSVQIAEVSVVSSYSDFTITYIRVYTFYAETSTSLPSSAELHVHDSLRNHLGCNAATRLGDMQVLDSTYFDVSKTLSNL